MTTVPRCWPDSTVIVMATGPSLTKTDVDGCRGYHTIAVKDAYRLAPWADVVYGCGADGGQWWRTHAETLPAVPRYTLDAHASPWATVLQHTGELGLETSPHGLRTGRNSGYQAINLAVHLGASKVVLLGFDMQPAAGGYKHHFFGSHAWRPGGISPDAYVSFLRCFQSLVEPLRAAGVQVVNATRSSALTLFPQMSIGEALA